MNPLSIQKNIFSIGYFRRRPRLLLALGCAFLAVAFSRAATANIYSFTDEKGVVHFSNLPHLDKRFRMVYRIPTDGNMRPNAWSASGPVSIDIGKYVPIIANAATLCKPFTDKI